MSDTTKAEKDFLGKFKHLHQENVKASLPNIEDAGIIALGISEINNELEARDQAFFVAGFQECVKYLIKQHANR